MSNLTEQGKENIIEKVGWICYDIYITTDNQVFNLSFRKLKEQLKGGSYGYTVNGKFKTKKWIKEHCCNVKNIIEL